MKLAGGSEGDDLALRISCIWNMIPLHTVARAAFAFWGI